MLRNKLASTLFRSLLRWNRRPEVVASKFVVDPVAIGAKPYLPPNVTSLRDAEGVQAAIFFSFRNCEATQESLDAGFKVLRELNDVGKKLSVRCDARTNRTTDAYQTLATFRVGQVVQHKTFNVRGIVTGWDLDETKTKQVVEVLPDLVDTNEFAGVSNLYDIVKVRSEELQLVEDKDLQRIINRNVKTFFEGYDVVRRRYIPNAELSYWYESDLKALENSAGSSKDSMSAAQQRQLNKSLLATQHSIAAIGTDMQAIMAKHAKLLKQPLTDTTVPAEPGTLKTDKTGKAIKSVADSVLEEVYKCIDGCLSEQVPTAPLPLPSQSLHTRPEEVPFPDGTFRQALRRGGVHRQPTQVASIADEVPSKEISKSKAGSKSVKLSATEIEKVYYAVGYLGNCFSALDQLLQLRFQARGIAYHDRLRVAPELTAAESELAASFTTEVTRITEAHIVDETAKQKNAETMLPAAIYKIGQIVRNMQLGYRGVICGHDQRPGQNLMSWEGIAGLQFGQEQPIYKILYDERDMADTVGRFDSRSYFLVAQENLEPVTERPDLLVNHRTVSHYFQSFDLDKGGFRAPPKLAYCFPQRVEVAPKVIPWKDPATSIAESVYPMMPDAGVAKGIWPSSVDDAEAAALVPVYKAIDELLVELFTYLRSSLAQTRVNDSQARRAKKGAAEAVVEAEGEAGEAELAAQPVVPDAPLVSMHDLLMLLKYARTQEHALYVESLLWIVWLAHESPEVCMLMRLSIAHAKRGQMAEAIEVVSRAIELDPHFAEAYNKRASYHHMLKGYEDCIVNANSSMEIFPDHVGALSGLSLCYEQQGKHQLAVKSVRKALELHPWAAHLPTMLISMLTESKGAKGVASSRSSANNAVRDN